MSRMVTTPPLHGLRADGMLPGGWWHDDPETGGLSATSARGPAASSRAIGASASSAKTATAEMVLTTYGRSTGFCIDPIEKKPLNHFYPGTSVLSFGTAGCNLGCKFCQNWDISKSRDVERLSEAATPEAIAEAARAAAAAAAWPSPTTTRSSGPNTPSTRPGPAARAGVKTVAVTAGYITPEARGPFYEFDGRRQRRPEGLHRGVLPAHHRSRICSRCWTRSRWLQARDRRLVRDHQPDHPAGQRLAGRDPADVRLDARSTGATTCRCTSRRFIPTSS